MLPGASSLGTAGMRPRGLSRLALFCGRTRLGGMGFDTGLKPTGANLDAEPAWSPPPDGLPPDARPIDLLGIRYVRCRTADGGELYLTRFGLPFFLHLQPENWFERDWFEANRERLVGTSVVYRLPTRPVNDRVVQLVVKWSRVGEDVPGDTLSVNRFINADFNSPFEEFSLLHELRRGLTGPEGIRIRTQRPLAIYVPPERLQLWQTGRSESKIAAKIARHPGVELDILRQYVLIYEWIKGVDLVEASTGWDGSPEDRSRRMGGITSLVIHELEQKGYQVVDMKPAHIIVRPRPDGSLPRDRSGQLIYALIDYELLVRTPQHEEAVRRDHRRYYLEHMARRFESAEVKPMPPHLNAVNILGVDYIYGQAESTGGRLWVAGRDPDLFNYFLPERWRRTPKRLLSVVNQVYRTTTKDNINLVWRVSRVGETPSFSDLPGRAHDILRHGYNSPFEEFAHAMELNRAGVSTVYLRAIYMTGRRVERPNIADRSRYEQLAGIQTPDGSPILLPDHEYITLWGFWNGPDKLIASHTGPAFRGVDVEHAAGEGIIPGETVAQIMGRAHERLRRAGFEHLRLRPNHLLLSCDAADDLVPDSSGRPELRLCNFELLRRLPPPSEVTAPPRG